MQVFPTELIYDAATDDAALEQLSVELARYIGARSGVIHWREIGTEEEQASFSGYYSAEQMAVYSHHFSDADLWARAISCDARANRAVNLAQLVSSRSYENSRIFNDWIRPMGDDTFHCLGATLRIAGIEGQVGFHRGKHQLPFDDASIARLDQVITHMARMMMIRSRLVSTERRATSVANTLNALADAIFTLDAKGRLLVCNAAGEAILKEAQGLRLERGCLISTVAEANKKLLAAISRAAAASSPEASTFRQPRPTGGYYVFAVVGSAYGASRSVTVCVSVSESNDAALASALRTSHGLAQAEAEVALRIAAGVSVSELAKERGTSVATVRTQVKSIASKLGCARQTEIGAIVNSIPRLWSC